MRGLAKLVGAAAPNSSASSTIASNALINTRHFLPAASRAISSSSNDGRGRGRGRGVESPFSAADPSFRAPGKPQAEDEFGDAFSNPSGVGRGRGRTQPLRPPTSPSVHPPPTFASSFDAFSTPSGRGRGVRPPSDPNPPMPHGRGDPRDTPEPREFQSSKPIFFRPENAHTSSGPGQLPEAESVAAAPPPRPLNISFKIPAVGRGKENNSGGSTSTPPEDNRHVRQSQQESPPRRGGGGRRAPMRGRGVGTGRGAFPQSVEGESGRGFSGEGGRGFSGERGGRGRGGRRGEVYARGGRGGRFGKLIPRKEEESKGLHLGDDADGEKLSKRLGEEGEQDMRELLDEISYRVLPCPVDEAYKDAEKMNFRIEFEPEYLMEDFNTNPDIDEKPPMSLVEALEKMKPFLVEYEGIQSEEEWTEMVNATLKRSPYLKAIVDEYSGPDRVTAKQQQQELERVSKTIPENVPSSVKRFTERALLSLQSNPGWGFDKKWKFMDTLSLQMNRHYK